MRRFAAYLLAAALCAASVPIAPAQENIPTLTLDDAIRMALQRNKMIKVAAYGPGISRAYLLAARGAFDPALQVNRTYTNTAINTGIGPIPIEDLTKTDYYEAGITGLLPTGTQYNIFASTQEVRDVYNGITKSFQTFGGFSVTQPLLKGFGFDYNLLQVRIAKANRGISDQQFRQTAINTVTNVIGAYSNLQFAHDELDSAERARAIDNRLLFENEKKYKVGYTSQSDVIESRAAAAQYDDPIISAERSVREAQNQLREYIGDETFFEDEPLFVLAPMPIPDITVDRRADLERAYKMRPDYEIAHLGIVANKATEAAARNSLLPEVDFIGGYGYNGLSPNFSPSLQMVQDHENPSVQAGIAVNIPLTFAVGRGNLRAARLTRLQSEESRRSLAADIAVEVAAADGQIEATRRRVAADESALALAKQALEAEEKKYKAGTGSTLNVVQEQQQLSFFESNLSAALAAQRIAVATYDQAIGTTLERYDIRLTSD